MSNLSGNRPTPTRGRASSQVVRLVNRLRELVAEQRALETGGNPKRLAAIRREIERLQCRLANVVRSELSNGRAAGQPRAPVPC
jgi:hypothetical protein